LRTFAANVPYFLPFLALSLGIGLLVARRLGERLNTRPGIAFLLVASLGLVVAATLMPAAGASSGERVAAGWCDLSRVGFAPLGTLVRVNAVSLNVLLFLPLGLAIGLLPGTRARSYLIVGGFALPLVIEATQSLVTVLGRGCESADAFDNAMGLAIGLVMGLSVSAIARWLGAFRLQWDPR
jgi:hypothetical protein